MIFSLSPNVEGKIDFDIPNTDIFCFFHSQTMTLIPESVWIHAICASLKMKRDVLLLEAPLSAIPVLNTTARWHVGDQFLWLAPRSKSVLLEAPHALSTSYKCLKVRLTSFK